jgi:hypothetical protein
MWGGSARANEALLCRLRGRGAAWGTAGGGEGEPPQGAFEEATEVRGGRRGGLATFPHHPPLCGRLAPASAGGPPLPRAGVERGLGRERKGGGRPRGRRNPKLS